MSMSMSGADLIEFVSQELDRAGYSFHEGDDGNGEEGNWFCWSDGKCDVETGDTVPGDVNALADALQHALRRLADAERSNRELRDAIEAVRAHDRRLDDAEEAPTGDDYNEVLSMLGAA